MLGHAPGLGTLRVVDRPVIQEDGVHLRVLAEVVHYAGVHFKIKDVPQVNGVAGLDDLGPGVLQNEIRQTRGQGRETKAIALAGIGRHHRFTAAPGEDDQAVAFHRRVAHHLGGVQKIALAQHPEDVPLAAGRVHRLLIRGRDAVWDMAMREVSWTTLGICKKIGLVACFATSRSSRPSSRPSR